MPKRMVTFYFVGPVWMLVDQRWLTVTVRNGREGVMARRRRDVGGRVWVELDTPTEVFVTKDIPNG